MGNEARRWDSEFTDFIGVPLLGIYDLFCAKRNGGVYEVTKLSLPFSNDVY